MGDLAHVISQNEAQEIYESMQSSTMMSISSSAPVTDMNELSDIGYVNEFRRLLNLSITVYEDRTRTQLYNSTIHEIYTTMV